MSCVVLARLPFPQMGEPVTEARSEQIEAEGGSSFRDYMVPEAVIKFRQGFGRLVRTKSDRGVVVVADRRIVAKNYGAIFCAWHDGFAGCRTRTFCATSSCSRRACF